MSDEVVLGLPRIQTQALIKIFAKNERVGLLPIFDLYRDRERPCSVGGGGAEQMKGSR